MGHMSPRPLPHQLDKDGKWHGERGKIWGRDRDTDRERERDRKNKQHNKEDGNTPQLSFFFMWTFEFLFYPPIIMRSVFMILT